MALGGFGAGDDLFTPDACRASNSDPVTSHEAGAEIGGDVLGALEEGGLFAHNRTLPGSSDPTQALIASGWKPRRQRNQRSPVVEDDVAKIPLTQNLEALIDLCDLDLIGCFTWMAHRSGTITYATTMAPHRWPDDKPNKWRTVFMHRLIIGASYGEQIDHRNRNGLDNRRANLRFCTQGLNNINQRGHADSVSGFKGVRYRKDLYRWEVRLTVAGNEISGGYFTDVLDAARAYNELALRHHGEWACLNIIPERL